MALALEGVRVVDIAQFIAAPGAAMYLADQGAEVIKIEPRGPGDPLRGLASTPFFAENGPFFLVINRNKRSLTLDVRKPAGREVLLRLVEQADVLIESFRPGVAERLGIGYEDLTKVNPRLVYASVTAYGTRGPDAGRAGYDGIVAGVSGAMSRRMPDGTPVPVGVIAGDLALPMLMAYGIMLALWHRERTGVGQRVEASLLHTYLAMQLGNYVIPRNLPDAGPMRPMDAASGSYRCGDGNYLATSVHTDEQFLRLCQVMGLDHVAEDPRFKDPAQKNELRKDVYPIFEELFKTAPAAEWLRRLQEADIPCGGIQDRADVVVDPQVVANEMLVEVDHPSVGPTTMVNVPLHLSHTPGSVRRRAPLIGEHTDEILRELGYSPQEIAELRAAEAV